MSALAPVVLFVYNRPEHTSNTLRALQANTLASKSLLIVYSDAPRHPDDCEQVEAVRKLLRAFSGFASVELICRENNFGLARSIVEGVTEVLGRYGKAIVLEDDLVTSPAFLQFMNAALDHYENDERVMNVNGYVLPGIQCAGHTFFTRIPTSWGWATWQRSWRHFSRDAAGIISRLDPSSRHAFDFDSTYPFFHTVVRNYHGKINTWAIFWYATIFERGGLCVSPPISLVHNIGNDGSGTNARPSRLFETEPGVIADIEFSGKVEENLSVYRQYCEFYRHCHSGLSNRLYMLLLPIARKMQILAMRMGK